MNANRVLVAEYLIAVSVAVVQEIRDGRMWPRPSRFVGAGIAFGVLGLAAPFISDKLAAAFGAGLVLALAYNSVNNADPAGGSGTDKPETGGSSSHG